MKSRLLICCFLLCTLFSCKKESEQVSADQSIVGKWSNTAVYNDPSVGGSGWQTIPASSREVLTLYPDTRFDQFLDVEAGKGRYAFDRSTNELLFQYEQDLNGSPARSVNRKMERCSADKLVLAVMNGGVAVFKKEYSRVK